MNRSCKTCGNPIVGKNVTYCNYLCGNRGKNIASQEALKQMARKFRDSAIITGDVAELSMRTGGTVRVSLVDLDLVGDNLWMMNDCGYAVRYTTSGSTKSVVRMHREVMARVIGRPLQRDELVDHVNRDVTDNRRSNLRLCNSTQNAHNYTKYSGWTSKYKGVCWDKARSKWKSEIRFDRQRWLIGRFDNEDEAAWNRDQWCLVLHEDFAVTNFEYV